jgi:hypothetical protein
MSVFAAAKWLSVLVPTSSVFLGSLARHALMCALTAGGKYGK